jgi:hypothetical protein
MQTLARLASMIIGWERRSLPLGAYRLTNIRQLEAAPELAAYTDCTWEAQFCDELRTVRRRLNVPEGLWMGMKQDHEGYAQVIAFLTE